MTTCTQLLKLVHEGIEKTDSDENEAKKAMKTQG